ncbi:MAG: sulfite exporter TauE/SafE family protein [Actinomycetota bacterium]
MTVEIAVVALVSVVVGAVLKSISGVGMPIVTIPAIAYVADIETAIAITALPNLALNGALAWQERAWLPETRDLVALGVTGFVGAVVGTLILVSVPEEPLIALLVAVVVVYAALFFRNPELRVGPERSRRLAPPVGMVSGLLQGSVGISAPVLASWIHSYRLPRNAQILSVTGLFAVAGLAQLPTLALSGELTGRWTVAALACVPALATIPVGTRLRQALSSDGFDRLVVLTLVASVVGLGIRTFF